MPGLLLKCREVKLPQWGMRERFIIKHQRIADDLLQRTSLRPAYRLLQFIALKIGEAGTEFQQEASPRSLVALYCSG